MVNRFHTSRARAVAVRNRCLFAATAFLAAPHFSSAVPIWAGYAGNAQHDGISTVASQSLQGIHWQTPVDLAPQYNGNDLLIHYGSPLVTQSNTVIVPVKTGATDGFKISAFNGANGAAKWSATTDYILPPHNWTPSVSPTLTPSHRLYYPGAGGTVYYSDTPDITGPQTVTQLSFYGLSNYTANTSAYNGNVFINTPITSDTAGNIFFGYQVTGATPLGLSSGIARIAANGTATYVSATTAAGDVNINKVVQNAAPAISRDGNTVYVPVSNGSAGSLLALNSTTLARQNSVALNDPRNGNPAWLNDDGTASPTIGPDGDVYYGVLENPFPDNHARGWLLHFSASLTAKRAGAFGWDDTASIVPASMVGSYLGTSTYLLMTKYNDYGGAGGSAVNKVAILDPNATHTDPVSGQTVMAEVMTIAGVTPDPDFPGLPGAVREWCINTAVVDPATDSILANSEDGKLYRWNLGSNTFTQVVTLTPGVGEAYTPTIIGADGTVYAINNATLFAVGSVPEPGIVLLPLAAMLLIRRRRALKPN